MLPSLFFLIFSHWLSPVVEDGGLLRTLELFSALLAACSMLVFFHLHRKLQAASRLDPITGLGNRGSLDERLEHHFRQYRQTGQPFHALFMELDQFHKINHVFGHDVGDSLLRLIGQRLSATSGKCSRGKNRLEVFRFTGGEFVAIIPGPLADADLQALVAEIQSDTDEAYRVDWQQIDFKLTFGLSTANAKVVQAGDMIRFADMARHYAHHPANPLARGADSHVGRWERHLLLHQHLSQAIELFEFQLMCQPVYDMHTLKLTGCEILLRWESPVLGEVSPEEFIPVAEASGLINVIGKLIFLNTVGHLRQWVGMAADFKVAINVSPVQLCSSYFYNLVADVLRENPELVRHIELEITETEPLANRPRVSDMLLALKSIGVGIALDDYGTGNTSFLNLQQGAFTRLKVDKRLVYEAEQSLSGRKVFRAVVDSARSLGLAVTVEGVETSGQYELVRDMGCGVVQGYLFSKPVKPELFGKMLENTAFTADLLKGRQLRAAGQASPT